MPAESFIAILTECLADRTFVVDYQRYYPVENDIDILKQACKDLYPFLNKDKQKKIYLMLNYCTL